MAISFSCGKCGKPYQVDERFAGKKAACRACGTINTIPGDDAAQDVIPLASPAPAMTSLQTSHVRVPHADPDLLPLRPAPAEPAPDPAERAAAEAGLILADEPDLAPTPPKRPQKVQKALPIEGCPHCGGAMANGATICTTCGFNLKTGKKIATAVVANEASDESDEAADPNVRPPTPSLRFTALMLIIIGVLISALPVAGLSAMAMTGPLIGAAMAVIGAAIYFIDGAWEWGLAGVGAMVLSIVIMLTFGGGQSAPSPIVASSVTPPPTPATTQSIPADLGPKVEEVAPGKYSIRAPGPKENPIEYWRPVLQDTDPKIRLIAIAQLAKLPERHREAAADSIAQAIADDQLEIRQAVMKHLALAKTPRTIAAAIQALDDKDSDIAKQAVKLLAEYKDDSAIEPLAKKYVTFGTPILTALGGYDAASKERILAAYKSLLDTADAKNRVKIMDTLAQSDPAGSAALLMANLADNDIEIRHTAMTRLSEMKFAPALEPIAQHLRDDPEAASKALLKFGPAAEKATAARLAETDAALRLLALNLLKEIGSAQSLDAIKLAAKDPDYNLAMKAREIWRKIDPGALPPIDEAIADLDAGKEFVARALASLKMLPIDEHQKIVARKLFELTMNDGDAANRTAAYETLELWADPVVKDLIIVSLGPDIDDAKRAYAIKLAVHFKDRRAVRPLCQRLADGKNLPEVLAALREFDSAPEEFLIPLIPKGDATVQGNCFDVLRDIGTRRCFMALNAVINNKTGEEAIKKHAKETMFAINRRLNTAAARKGTPTTRPATQPQEPSAQH